MSDVQRFRHDGIDGMACYENGAWISHEDYADLKSQRDALAAENVVLKVSRQAVVNAFDDAMNEFGMARGETAADYPAPETPATDAYLNSVRAKGVEMFVKELGSPYGDGEGRDYETGFNRAIEVSKSKAAKFVTQLRAGKDGE